MKLEHVLITALAPVVLALPMRAVAQESTLIAGWDFSQYAVPENLSLDGLTFGGSTLASNHSDLDPTAGAGIESNAFGTMYLNGSFGSTPTPLDGSDPFVPVDAPPPPGSLDSNVNQALLGFGSPAACVQAQTENMPFANCTDVAMYARESASIVFAADRNGEPNQGFVDPPGGPSGTWSVSFAGKTLVSGTASVTVQYSADGSSYTNAGTASLTEVDTAFTIPLGSAQSEKVFVRLVMPSPASLGQEATIDNLGIAVPEPAGAAFAALGALAMLGASRRR